MKDLQTLAQQAKDKGIEALFDNSARLEQFSHDVAGIYFDFSKTHINQAVLDSYLQLADQTKLRKKTQDLFSGVKINVTEQRAVLHTALRDSGLCQVDYQNKDDKNKAVVAQQALFDMLDTVEAAANKPDGNIKDIIHIGIGGSVLGPKVLYQALTGLDNKIKVHFISNIDAHQLQHVIAQCNPASTIVVAVSKTFTTIETLTNLNSVTDWLKANNVANYQQRLYAVSAYKQSALDYGIQAQNILQFPEWVGGRYSLWSAVSLSVAIVLGKDKFQALLNGAQDIDQHFLNTPLQDNVCFLSAMMDHWYSNYFNSQTRATFAYDFRLRSLVDYLQQLETESNGKQTDLEGNPVVGSTSPVVWGGVGTDVQHSVFQLIHQGTHFIPTEFILVKHADHDLDDHQQQLLANGLAQSAALLTGQSLEQVEQDPANQNASQNTKKAKVFSGQRPSSTLLLEQLDAYSLGALIAFYEHRTFCYGVLCNINSFDQMGVELGKKLAKQVEPLLSTDRQQGNNKQGVNAFDASTKALLQRLKS